MAEQIEKMFKSTRRGVASVFELIGIIILAAIVEAYFAPLNPETYIENWGFAFIGFIIFAALYLLSIYLKHRILSKICMFMMIFWLTWLIVDWDDFILFLRGGQAV